MREVWKQRMEIPTPKSPLLSLDPYLSELPLPQLHVSYSVRFQHSSGAQIADTSMRVESHTSWAQNCLTVNM